MMQSLTFAASIFALSTGNRAATGARTRGLYAALQPGLPAESFPSMHELALGLGEAGSSFIELPDKFTAAVLRPWGASTGPGDGSSSRPGGSSGHTVYVGVMSAPQNDAKRKEIREQWLTPARKRFAVASGEEPRVKLEFIIGRLPITMGHVGHTQGAVALPPEIVLEEHLANEHAVYGDVYRIPAHESYAELPDKVLMMLSHSLEAGYDFMVKIDDDQRLDVDKVLAVADSVDPLDPLYAGPYLWDKQAYSSQVGADEQFKPYFGGPCYMLSRKLVSGIAREHLSHSVAYNTYGSSSEDVDMGRWVAFEDKLFAERGAKLVEYRSVGLAVGL